MLVSHFASHLRSWCEFFGSRAIDSPSAEAAPVPAELSSSEWLGAARTYLGLVSRAQHHLAGMAESLTQALQDDFVAARKADPKVSGEDFGRWLTLTRLVAASGLAEAVELKHYE